MRASLYIAAALLAASCHARQQANIALQPGEYEYDTHTIGTQEQGDQMGVRHCVDRKEVLDPRLIFSFESKNCRFPKFTMAQGKIDAQMICQNGSVSDDHIIAGTYTPTSFSVDVSTTVSGGAQGGYHDNSRMHARRVGPCTESSMP